MYVNGKIISVETIPVIEERMMKKNGRRGEFKLYVYLICCKNFCKCHNVPPSSTIKKRMSIEERKSDFQNENVILCP
jgi:hypothetical protein